MTITGYRHRAYAESFAAFGSVRELPTCGGWLVERAVPESPFRDAMGCYPLFDCVDWAGLPRDLSAVADALVSVSLVTTPFAEVSESNLRRWFDLVVPFKEHYVTDLRRSFGDIVTGRHRRNLRTALREVRVTTCPEPAAHIDEWCTLYGQLVSRHGITGLRAFSRSAFEVQLRVPGLVMFIAAAGDETIGAHLWYECGDVAYGHLGATSGRGYALMASYALYAHAMQYFVDRVRWLDLGGVAGLSDGGADDGLRRFKAGWATETRGTFLCGRILQPAVYESLSPPDTTPGSYFPAYRDGELASVRRGGSADPP